MDAGGTTLDEYAEMLALINTDLRGAQARPIEAAPMLERFGLTDAAWGEITTFWVGRMGQEPQLGAAFGERFMARMRQLDEEWLDHPLAV